MKVFIAPDFNLVTGQSEISKITEKYIRPDRILIQNNSLANALKIVIKNFRLKPDLVYITLSRSVIGAIRDYFFLKTLKPKRVISHIHGYGILNPNVFVTKNIYSSHDIIVLTESSAVNILTVYPNLERETVHVLHNPINIPENQICFDKKEEYQKLSICYFSNIMKSKGILEFEKLAEKFYHNYEFNAAGRNLENLKLGSCIHYNGPVYDAEKVNFLNKNHILIFYSSYKEEFFPISLIEAICFGMLCFVKRHNNLEKIFNEKNIIWIDTIDELFQYLNSPEQLVELQMKAFKWIKINHKSILKKYSIEKYQTDFLNILK